MRRQRPSRPRTLFRGSELPRLASLVLMLGLLGFMIPRAREPATWRWLTGEEVPTVAPDAMAHSVRDMPSEAISPGPTDEDPQELDAAREELQAVADKTPLGKEEMPAYWRLMSWQQHQSIASLLARADGQVTFRQLWQQPDKWRGKLLQLHVQLRQTAEAKDLADNELGLKSVWEAWGWNSDSQPYSYWLVVPELPPGMPTGPGMAEEATFVGYFLKLLPYEDHQGKTVATPLLIGRLIWHPAAAHSLAQHDDWQWTGVALFALLGVLIVRWGLLGLLRGRRQPPRQPQARDDQAVETWLEATQVEPQNGHLDHDSNFRDS